MVKHPHPHLTRYHLIQSAAAGIFIFSVFWAMNSLRSELAVASLGASAFIAFSFPNAKSSQAKYIIGGYGIGIVCGLICHALIPIFGNLFIPGYIPASAAALFFVMLSMTVLNMEHPPAAALAVAITLNAHPLYVGLAGISCAVVLCMIRRLFIKLLKDL